MSVRICHLIDANIDTSYFRSIAKYHDPNLFPVSIGSISPPGALHDALSQLSIPVFSLNISNRFLYSFALLRLIHFLYDKKISILHAHCFYPTFIGLLAARVVGIRFVFTRHHSDHHTRLRKLWHSRIDAWCARQANAVIAVSHAASRILTDTERVPKSNISVVYNGIEMLNVPSADSILHTRNELELGSQPVLLMIARLHEEKGHKFFFEALRYVVQQIGPVTALLAGEGPHKSRLLREANYFGVSHYVRFIGRRTDIPQLLCLSSIVVLPSLAESFGFAALEAMSMGVPVVVSDTGGLPEIVQNGFSGIVVPQSDGVSLAEAITNLLVNPSFSSFLGGNGRIRARDFTFQRMIAGYEAVYRQLIC